MLLDFYARCAILAFLSSFPGCRSSSCNEAVCASIVSKCTLLKSCDCDIGATPCTCCKKCYACLGYLYSECCSCVGLCPGSSPTPSSNASLMGGGSTPSQISQVGALRHPDNSLFRALTQNSDDELGRWTSLTFPYDLSGEIRAHLPSFALKAQQQSRADRPQSTLVEHLLTFNCTVSYLSQCISTSKCQKSCESMGAAYYRWFQDACCECIGATCINYGIDESRCAACPEDDLDVPELTPEERKLLETEYAEYFIDAEEAEEELTSDESEISSEENGTVVD